MTRAERRWNIVLEGIGFDNPAPEGTMWVCGACGRTTTRARGDMGDTSCVIAAVLCHLKKPRGKFKAVTFEDPVATHIMDKLRELEAHGKLREVMQTEADAYTEED